MKKFLNHLMIAGLFSVSFIFISCQEEFEELPGSDADATILASSSTAKLIERASGKDGSFDNVIDGASCFAIQFPYVVNVNGLDITIDSMEDINLVKQIASGIQVNDDVLQIIFPITVTKSDFTELVINGKEDLRELARACNESNDDPIGCISFVYPMTLYTFDINKQQTGNVTVNGDKDLRQFFANLSGSDLVSIDFPVSLKKADGTKVQVSTNAELAITIANAKDDCDDVIYNEDDCVNCTTEQLTAFLSGCASWYVHDFELDNEPNLEQEFSGFEFSFRGDGSVTVSKNGNSSAGTWAASGTGNNISVVINIPDYPNFNATWKLHSLENYGDWKKVKFRFGDKNELVFKSNCGSSGGAGVNPDNLRAILKECQWIIKKVKNQGEEIERLLEQKFSFGMDGTVLLSNGVLTTEGSWEITTNEVGYTVLAISIGNEPGLSFEWPISELRYDRLEFGIRPNFELILEKSCETGGGIVCTMEARAGLNVYVRFGNSTSASPEGVTVTAVDGDYSEVLINVNPDMADYAGAFEREGNYFITVTKEGYKTYTSEKITVTADECHVIARVLQVMLEPEE